VLSAATERRSDILQLKINVEWIESFRIAASRSQLEFASCDDVSVDRIVLDTTRRFKGLERSAIVAILPDGDLAKLETAYCITLERPLLPGHRVIACRG
jgi:hypothetical protein